MTERAGRRPRFAASFGASSTSIARSIISRPFPMSAKLLSCCSDSVGLATSGNL
jgi:hypothetical protein